MSASINLPVAASPTVHHPLAALPPILGFQVIEFLPKSEFFDMAQVNRSCASLIRQASLTRYHSDLVFLDRLARTTEKPTIEDFQRLHRVEISAFTENSYRSVVRRLLELPLEMLDEKPSQEKPYPWMATALAPFLFTATLDCSLNVRKRFVSACTEHKQHIHSRIGDIIPRLFAGPGKMTDEQLNRSAFPQYAQAFAEKAISMRLSTRTGRGPDPAYFSSVDAGDWFGTDPANQLWKNGIPVLPLTIEDALVSRIQTLAAQREQTQFKVQVYFSFVRTFCFPPRTFAASLLDRLTAIKDVSVRSQDILE